MNNNLAIQIKAALLMTVFALNTLVGFACALGMDIGFSISHHQVKEVAKSHVHSDGKKHGHEKKMRSNEWIAHGHAPKHNNEKENCCTGSVVKIFQSEKSVPQAFAIISPVFFTTIITAYYNIDVLYSSQVDGSIKYFVRSYHPPIPDIRIAIQSFQI